MFQYVSIAYVVYCNEISYIDKTLSCWKNVAETFNNAVCKVTRSDESSIRIISVMFKVTEKYAFYYLVTYSRYILFIVICINDLEVACPNS